MALSNAQFDEIFHGVASGKSLSACLRKLEASFCTFYDGIDSDPILKERYARARIHQAESGQSRILEAVDDVLRGELDPNAARVAIDALKWNAARMHPAIYGERLKHEVTGKDDGPIVMKWEK